MTDLLFIVLSEKFSLSDASQFCARDNPVEAKMKTDDILAYIEAFQRVSDDLIRAKPVSSPLFKPKDFEFLPP